jgi:hypothetical protein
MISGRLLDIQQRHILTHLLHLFRRRGDHRQHPLQRIFAPFQASQGLFGDHLFSMNGHTTLILLIWARNLIKGPFIIVLPLNTHIRRNDLQLLVGDDCEKRQLLLFIWAGELSISV